MQADSDRINKIDPDLIVQAFVIQTNSRRDLFSESFYVVLIKR